MMRKIRRFIGRLVLLLVLLGVALWLFGPREQVDLTARFDATQLAGGVDAYFQKSEARFADITPGAEKRVIWAGAPGQKTSVSVLYVHGFSASSEEIRPVPDRVAKALKANLVFARLRGHGRGGPALAQATATDWMFDLTEGLAAAKQVGEQVIVLSTSTGGTLVVAAALDPDLMTNVKAAIFVSPKFGLNTPVAPLMTWPAARYWLPQLAGTEYSYEPANAENGRYWTTSYPSVALLPMAALVQLVAGLDVSQARLPALFWFSDNDRVVRADITRKIADRWGGPTTIQTVTMGPDDDPSSHVIAGDILSPGQTDAAAAGMISWISGLK